MVRPVFGSSCKFEINVNGFMTPLVCAKNFRVTVTSDLIETTTYGDGYWKSFDFQALSYELAFEGVTRLPDVNDTMNTAFDVLAAQMAAVPFRYDLWFVAPNGELRVLSGEVLISQAELNAAISQHSGFVLTLKGSGAFEMRTTACEATIASANGFKLLYTGGATASWRIMLNDISADTQIIQYSLNQGARVGLTTYTPGSPEFEFDIDLLHNQANTLTIYPQCTAGTDGTVLNIPINASGLTFVS